MLGCAQPFLQSEDYEFIKLGEANQGKFSKKQFIKFNESIKSALQNEDCIGTLVFKNNKEIYGMILGDSITKSKLTKVIKDMADT